MECKYCKEKCSKAGKQVNGLQRYRYKVCKKYQQQTFTYDGHRKGVYEQISLLVCNGVGIRELEV